jgi:hypothetical protein
MSAETPAYNQTYIQAWTVISLLVSAFVFLCLIMGSSFLATGHWIWDLLRYLASPII